MIGEEEGDKERTKLDYKVKREDLEKALCTNEEQEKKPK